MEYTLDQSSQRRKRLVVVLQVLFYIGLVFAALSFRQWFWHSTNANNDTIRMNGLIIERSALNWGETWETDCHRVRIPFRNETPNPITIVDFATSCNCSEVTPSCLTIPGNSTAEVEVRMDIRPRSAEEARTRIHSFQVTLRPVLAHKQTQQDLIIEGLVKRRAAVSDFRVHFGEIVPSEKPIEPRRVDITCFVPHASVEVQGAESLVSLAVASQADKPGAFTVTVLPKSSLPSGPFSGRVVAYAVTSDGQRLAVATLEVEGIVVPPVRPVPSHLLFGSVPVGGTADAEVVLQMPPNKQFTIIRTESTGPELGIHQASQGSSLNSRVYRVRLRSAQEGSRQEQVRFIFREKNGREQAVCLTVTYFGVDSPADQRTRKGGQ